MPGYEAKIRRPRLPARGGSLARNVGLLICLAASLLATGCSKNDSDDDLVLATVGDVEITGSEYKSKLAKFKEHELPR